MTKFFEGPKPRLFAHRGASGEAPENTMAAFQRAVALGIQYVELDVRASQDGQILVMHDETIERTTNGVGPVPEYSLAALQQLDAGYRFSSDGGSTLPFRASDVIIPSLEEVLATFPELKYTIEIKQVQPPIEGDVLEVVRRCGRLGDVIIASESDDVLARARALAPDVPTNLGFNETVQFMQMVSSCRFDDYDPPGAALQIPPRYQNIELVTEQSLSAAHQVGLEMHVWTVNDRAEMKRLFELGVDGIMSDFPGRLLDVAEEVASMT